MSSIKKADPQQRMTNMLLAGNLYKSHKIDKGIQKISQIQQAAMKQNMQMHQQTMAQNREIIANQNAANQIAQSQLRMQLSQAQQIERTKLLKNTFFEISEEVEDVLKAKKITNIEKFFRYGSIKATLNRNEIDTDITDELSEKKLIRDTIKKVENEISKAEKKFTKNDKKDLEEIYKVLEVDEEAEIQKLGSSEVVLLAEKSKKLKAWYEKAKKVAGGAALYFVLPTKFNKDQIDENRSRAKKNKDLIIPTHFQNKITANKIFEHTGLESLDEILDSKVFEWWYNHKFKDFFAKMGFWESASFMNMNKAGIKAIEKGNKKSLFGKVTKVSDVLESHGKKYKKDLDKLIKQCEEAFKNPFPKAVLKEASKAKAKISDLKKDIESEKDQLKKIFKKHPFVKTIISNR